METVSYGGWSDCIRLSNDRIELIATTAVGPRIIRFGFIGGPNMFCEFPDMTGKTGGDEWRVYGGHRLWHAPEHPDRTYVPDNAPIKAKSDGEALRLVQPVESFTGIRKEIELRFAAGKDAVEVRHRLVNEGAWEVELAPWALSVMAPGGTALIPQEPFAPHPDALLPARPVVVWPYTRMNDPRISWGERFIRLRQANGQPPIKFGVRNTLGHAVYTLGKNVFLKQAALVPDAVYPDFNVNFEFFTNSDMLEVESLGPLTKLAPHGGTVEHIERWSLFRERLPDDEDRLAEAIAGLVIRG